MSDDITNHYMQANQIEKLAKRVAHLEFQIDKMYEIHRGSIETIDMLNEKVNVLKDENDDLKLRLDRLMDSWM